MGTSETDRGTWIASGEWWCKCWSLHWSGLSALRLEHAQAVPGGSIQQRVATTTTRQQAARIDRCMFAVWPNECELDCSSIGCFQGVEMCFSGYARGEVADAHGALILCDVVHRYRPVRNAIWTSML